MDEAITNIFVFLEKLGLVDVILPFCIIFAVTYGIFEKVNAFGDGKRNVHILVSFALSFMVVGVLAYVDLIATITHFFVLLIIAAVSFALVYALLGGEFRWNQLFKKKEENRGGAAAGGSRGSSQANPPPAARNAGRPPNLPPQE